MSETTNQANPVRLGIIGSGLAVKWLHWPALQQMTEQFRVVQTCDVEPNAAKEIAELVGAGSTTSDYREVLANPEVDAVLLSLPIHLTAKFILDSARAGKHVIAEKPIASSWEQAVDLVALLKTLPVVVEIAENYHYRPDLVKARELIDAGRLGDVFLIQAAQRSWTDISKGFAQTPWRQDNQYRGGVLSDATIHDLAGLRELGGDVEQLQAFVKHVHPVMGGYDTMVCNLRFRSGALGQLTYSGAAKPGKPDKGGFTIFGTEGTIYVEDHKVTLVRPASGHENNVTRKDETDVWEASTSNGYYEEFLNFYNAIRNGEAVKVTAAVALKDFELIMRALDSAESMKVVLL